MVLVHHVVDLPLVQRVGEIATKDWPQVIVLSRVVAPEALSKLAPTFDHLGVIGPILLDLDPCLEISQIAKQGVVHGEHEADVSTLMARRGASPPCPDNYSDDAEDSDHDHQCCLEVIS
jgi:hypothetical protein